MPAELASQRTKQSILLSTVTPQEEMGTHRGGTVLAQVSRQLAALEKRDWEQWLIVAATGTIVALGMLALLFPAAFSGGQMRVEITVPKQLFVALVAALAVFNTYMVWRRIQLRRLREQIISTTMQSELVRLQSYTDPLTEVYNRRSLEEMAGRYISYARRHHSSLSFLLIDVDRFRQVNTRFGHLTGDFVLAEIAGLLRHAVRGSDAVVRYGGDEFLIIVADAPRAGAEQVVQRIKTYLCDWNHAQHLEDFELSLSIGLAEWKDGETLDEVLDVADQDMYMSKNRGTSTLA